MQTIQTLQAVRTKGSHVRLFTRLYNIELAPMIKRAPHEFFAYLDWLFARE